MDDNSGLIMSFTSPTCLHYWLPFYIIAYQSKAFIALLLLFSLLFEWILIPE